MSGLGKGVTAASLAKLLSLSGFKVTCAKIDPYLNVDAGTMNPLIHGEVFVSDDGGETDMDLGTYERFLNQNLTKEHNITTGQIYNSTIEGERTGKYLGNCVQIIPHITDEIKRRIRLLAQKTKVDILLMELGGTVGDIEGLPFLEAFRQMRLETGADNTLFIHTTLVPVVDPVGEQKTKPTQHSVQELRRIGIQPDIIVVRSKSPLTKDSRKKISLFTSVDVRSVISNHDCASIYSVPQMLEAEGILDSIFSKMRLRNRSIKWSSWKSTAKSFSKPSPSTRIAMVGKYVTLADSYVSINHALLHSGATLGTKTLVEWLDAEELETNVANLHLLDSYDGILVPGGFGTRGSEGKIAAANYAAICGIPYLGICFGFQLAVVAHARHRCGLEHASSSELDQHTPHPVIDLLPEQREIVGVGGSMRLGAHTIYLSKGSLANRIYGKLQIQERHRHRFEVNPKYQQRLETGGIKFTGFSDGKKRMECLEIPDHPFYFGIQFHAEFTSRPGAPAPAFLAFVEAANKRKKLGQSIRGH